MDEDTWKQLRELSDADEGCAIYIEPLEAVMILAALTVFNSYLKD